MKFPTLLKAFTLTLLSFLAAQSSYAQETKIDSTWEANGHTFELNLQLDEAKEAGLNTSFTLLRNGQLITSDTLYCSMLDLAFRDMNEDGFLDLLIHHDAGARSNKMQYLFLFRKETNDYKKVLRFEEVPNLNKTNVKGILAATILTGTVEYRFFELDKIGQLIDLDLSVVDASLDGKGYDKAIQKLRKSRQ